MRYLVQFGFAPKLANLELSRYLAQRKLKFAKHHISSHIAELRFKHPLDTQAVIHDLGGTVRLAGYLFSSSSANLASKIASHLIGLNRPKPTFTLSFVNTSSESGLAPEIKSILHQASIPSRYLDSPQGLASPLIIHKQNLVEYILLFGSGSYHVYSTLAVTDPLSWQSRDRDRPLVNPASGMLPPKISRILVNLGLPQPSDPGLTLFDPFCGDGTILAEALVRGFSVIGSDIDPEAVRHTRTNLDWVTSAFKTSGSTHLIPSDFLRLNLQDLPQQPDALVTEVDLGPSAKLSPFQIATVIGDHHRFYSRVLPHTAQFLRSGRYLVIALPQYRHPSSVKSIHSLIDTCEKSGYTLAAGPLTYSKPQAQVKRAICIFTKK